MRPKIPLAYTRDSLKMIVENLVASSLIENVGAIRHSILQQIALIVNKFLPDSDLQWAKDLLLTSPAGLLKESNISIASIRTSLWISKALILRLTSIEEILNELLGLITNKEFGHDLALGFRLILGEDEILSKENGANIRLLAKQKVFTFFIPAMARSFRDAEATVKSNYLVALSGVLRYVSTEILRIEIVTLLPLLLQSLDLDNQDVKSTTIETLRVVCQESPKAIEEHVASLVGRLLNAAASPNINSAASLFNHASEIFS